MLPSGKQRKFDNRVSWARTYLQKALLLSSPGRSKFRITERGLKVLKEDKLGLDAIYLQAKRWEGTISSPEVQGFAGALIGKKARKGVFITTSTFSQQAKNFASGTENLKIILIDGEQLAQLMIDHDIGVTEESRYIVKKVDLDYFGDE